MTERSTISSRPQSVRLPPIHVSARDQLQAQRMANIFGIRADQHRAELIRNIRYEAALANWIEEDHMRQTESATSERELKAENNRDNFKANLKPGLKVPNAPGAKKADRDANRAQRKTEEREDLERKVCEPKEESEELVLTEPEESEEESKEDVTLEFLDIMDQQEQNDIRHQYRMEKMKEKIDGFKHQRDRLREKPLMNSNITEQKQEQLKYTVESSKSGKISIREKVRPLLEKMAEICSDNFGNVWSPDFPLLLAPCIEELSSDVLEDMTPEALLKKQKQLLKSYDSFDRLLSQTTIEARREERRRKRREIALAPPVKVTGKKQTPRSWLPKIIKKEEPVEMKKQKNDDVYSDLQNY